MTDQGKNKRDLNHRLNEQVFKGWKINFVQSGLQRRDFSK